MIALVYRLAPARGEQGEMEKGRWIGERFSKQGGCHLRLVLGACTMRTSQPAMILVYREASARLSHSHHSVGLSPSSSQAVSLKTPPAVGRWAERMLHSKCSEGEGRQTAHGPTSGSTGVTSAQRPLVDLARLSYRIRSLGSLGSHIVKQLCFFFFFPCMWL